MSSLVHYLTPHYLRGFYLISYLRARVWVYFRAYWSC